MDLVRINLTNFRNFSPKTEIELPRAGLLVAAAPNAVGKTNFLESIMVLLRGKTWRARIQECVKWGEDSFLLEGEIERQQDNDSRVAIRYHKPSHKIRIEEDGLPASVVAFYAHYPFVMFVPEDTFLLSRGPAQRRNFINHVLVCQPNYVSALVQYHRVLRQRNEALKRARSAADVSTWTDLLVEHATSVWRHRDNLVTYWNDKINEIYHSLSGEEKEFSISLAFGTRDRERLVDELNRAFRLEHRYGYTLYGPHRDDLVVLTKQKRVATALSGGQMKSLVVALKILSHRYVRQVTKEEPLLLLDDVFSELDEKRQVTLVENLPNTQTIITCTTLPEALRRREGVYLLDLQSIIQEKGREKKSVGTGVTEEAASSFLDLEGGARAKKFQTEPEKVAVT
jgi:DNA replication and repair protein RecF